MKWKKLFFAGAVLLQIAACSNSTAPTSPSALNALDRNALSTKQGSIDSTATTPTVPTTPGVNNECAALVIHTGATSLVCVPTIAW
jgi:hypothetical protein